MQVGDVMTIPEPSLEVLAVKDSDHDVWTRVPGGWSREQTGGRSWPWADVAGYAPLVVTQVAEPLVVTQAVIEKAHAEYDESADIQNVILVALKELGIHAVSG